MARSDNENLTLRNVLLWDAKRLLVNAPLTEHGKEGPPHCSVCEFQHKLDAWINEAERFAHSATENPGAGAPGGVGVVDLAARSSIETATDWKARADSQMEYSIQLQQLIERFCAGDPLPHPNLFHHRLLAKLRGSPVETSLPPHQQRVVDEKAQLDDRLSKLVANARVGKSTWVSHRKKSRHSTRPHSKSHKWASKDVEYA